MCEARDELQILQENNKVEIERVQEAERKQAKQKVAVVEERLQNKDQQVTEVLNQLTSLKKEKHDELMKIRLEYDAKVLSLRKQNQKTAQQKGQANAANHEIFRKKWQHMKAESEREIASLKRTIADLQRKADMQGTSTKRRKF
ncbi:coiled-coil domain-containing protein 152-like [Glandiceps talaboti]